MALYTVEIIPFSIGLLVREHLQSFAKLRPEHTTPTEETLGWWPSVWSLGHKVQECLHSSTNGNWFFFSFLHVAIKLTGVPFQFNRCWFYYIQGFSKLPRWKLCKTLNPWFSFAGDWEVPKNCQLLWLVNQPPPNIPPKNKVLWSWLINRWFPLTRP